MCEPAGGENGQRAGDRASPAAFGRAVGTGEVGAASSSRRWAAPRTRSTPTSWSARCSPTAWFADDAADADLVVVNTCAFIEEARQESIDTILALADAARDGARLVVTGCLAERYGDELADALPEVDAVAGFGVPVPVNCRRKPLAAGGAVPPSTCSTCPARRRRRRGPTSRSPRAATGRAGSAPSRPSGPQRSRRSRHPRRGRRPGGGVRRSCSSPRTWPYGAPTRGAASGPSCRWSRPSPPACPGCGCSTSTRRPHRRADRRHLRHRRALLRPVAPARLQPLLRRMRRWGDGERFLQRIGAIRRRGPTPPSARTSSSATPARPRPTTTSCWPSSRRPGSTGAGSSPSARRRAPTPPASTARSPPASSGSAWLS